MQMLVLGTSDIRGSRFSGLYPLYRQLNRADGQSGGWRDRREESQVLRLQDSLPPQPHEPQRADHRRLAAKTR